MMKNNFYKMLFFSLILVVLAGCSRVKAVKEQEADLKELCERNDIQWQWDSVTQVVTLSKATLRAKALVGSDVVVIGEEKVYLSASLRRSKDKILAPADFERKVIVPLTEKTGPGSSRLQQIVIDAGHGGKDPGAKGKSGVEEKTVVLDIAKRLKKDLEREGVKVVMTRDQDEFISLPERTQIASRSRADLFVSIHANSSRARNAGGLEVFYLRNLDPHERKEDEDQVKENQKALFRLYSMQRDSTTLDNILSDMLYSYKKAESERIANFITHRIADAANVEDRGSKSSGFFVLRNTLIPAVLVEVGFLSNFKEEQLLDSPWYRQKVADGIAKSLLDYANE